MYAPKVHGGNITGRQNEVTRRLYGLGRNVSDHYRSGVYFILCCACDTFAAYIILLLISH